MKLILTFILMLLASTPSSESLNSFNTTINDGYAKYEVIEEKSNIYYTVKLIRGINKDKMYFGAFLFNEDAKSHKLVMIVNDKQYLFPQTSRGDYVVPAMALEDNVTICILDELDNERARYEINMISVNEFNNKTDGIINGLNHGLSATKTKTDINFMELLTYIFLGLIVVFGGILAVMAITKKGLFHPHQRRAEVFNFKDYVEKMSSQAQDNNIVINDEDIIETKVDEPQPEEETPIVNMYPYQRLYDDDDDEDSVKTMLKQRGFSTDYQSLSEDEKNKVMLELMKMRDLQLITRNQYQKEIINLWKN